MRSAAGIAVLLIAGVVLGLLWANWRGNPAVATVNGEPIRERDFYHRLQLTAGGTVLGQMVKENMALQFARKQGTLPSDADVNAKYAEASKQPGFEENLKKTGQTAEDVKHAILLNLAETSVLSKGVKATDADAEAFYKQNIDHKNAQARYYHPDMVTIAAVVTGSQEDAEKAVHDLASGESFADVARKYSKDRSAANGGVLPPIRRGQVNAKNLPGLEDAVFAMREGEQRDTLQVGSTWWTIRCLKRTPETTVPFDKVREECGLGAALAKGLAANGQTVQSDAASFEKSADIRILAPTLRVVNGPR